MDSKEILDEDKAESGLQWGFELESIVLETIGDADEILEEKLLDLLLERNELQQLFAQFVEFAQKIPEFRKKYGNKDNNTRGTLREEIRIFLHDISDGAWHRTVGEGAHQKLVRIKKDGDVYIKRVTDDYVLR